MHCFLFPVIVYGDLGIFHKQDLFFVRTKQFGTVKDATILSVHLPRLISGHVKSGLYTKVVQPTLNLSEQRANTI